MKVGILNLPFKETMSKTQQDWEGLITGVTAGDWSVLPLDQDNFCDGEESAIAIVSNYSDDGASYIVVGQAAYQDEKTLANAKLFAESKNAISELVRIQRFMLDMADELEESRMSEMALKIRNAIESAH